MGDGARDGGLAKGMAGRQLDRAPSLLIPPYTICIYRALWIFRIQQIMEQQLESRRREAGRRGKELVGTEQPTQEQALACSRWKTTAEW